MQGEPGRRCDGRTRNATKVVLAAVAVAVGAAVQRAWNKMRKKRKEEEEMPLHVQVDELRKVNEEIAEGYHRLWRLWLDAVEAKHAAEMDSKRWMRKLKDTQDEMFALRREMEQIRRRMEVPDVQLSIDFEAKLNTRRVSHEVATAAPPDVQEWEEGLDALRQEAALLRFAIQEIERGAFANASNFQTPKDRKALLPRTRSPLRRLHRLSDKENVQ